MTGPGGFVTAIEQAMVLPECSLRGASDSELGSALRIGDLAALDEVFRRHAAKVAGTIRRTVGRQYVDDVVQEVFLSLWRAPERFQPEKGSLVAYLGCLSRGRAIDAVRSDGAWQRRNLAHGPHTPADGEEVESVVLGRLSAVEVRTALRALPKAERVAIELAFFGGLSYREVAVELGQAEGTVKSRIRAGLRRLELALRAEAAAA